MKTLNQKLLYGSLVMLVVAFSAVFIGAEDKRTLTDREMAAVVGSAKKCAQCLDMCSNVGTENDCNEDRYEIPCSHLDDWNPCNSKYRETTTPGNTIMYCSLDEDGGWVECEDFGELKSCSSLFVCFCIEDWRGDHCTVVEFGDHTDYDECS